MNILTLLEYTEQWLMEIDAESVDRKQLSIVPRFLKHLGRELDYAEHVNVQNLNTQKVIGLMQSLRNPEVGKYVTGMASDDPTKVDMSPGQHTGDPRSQQRLAHGFAGKQNSEIKFNNRDMELVQAIADSLAEVGLYDMEKGRVLDLQKLSLVRDFLSVSGQENPLALLDRNNFDKAYKNFIERKVKRVAQPSDADPESKTAKEMDMNTFIFAMGVANARNRGKKAWENYVDPDLIGKAKSRFEVQTNKQEAAANLLDMGFLHRVDGRMTPNWERIDQFKKNVIGRVRSILEAGASLRQPQNDEQGRMSSAEENYINLMKLIKQYLPTELYSAAKRSAIGKVKSAFSSDNTSPEVKNVILKYLQDFERQNEFSPPSGRDLSAYVQKSVELIAMKMVLVQLQGLLAPDSKPVNVNMDIKALRMNISKFMRNRS